MKCLQGKLPVTRVLKSDARTRRRLTVWHHAPVRIVCETSSSEEERRGHASVEVRGGGGLGVSAQIFSFQVNPSKK